MSQCKSSSYEAKVGDVDKCVLLYSGGLDTSVMVRWLQEIYRCDVYTVTLDVGQRTKDLEEVRDKALSLGAVDAYLIDAKKEFADEYISRAIKANALYQGVYPIGTSLARPLQAKWAIKIAEKVGADAVAHGCSGKGNDQIRFDVTVTALNPNLKIIAPVREWNMSRDLEISYALKYNIPIPVDLDNPYSIDENLWSRSVECGVLEYIDKEPPRDILGWCTPPEEAPGRPEYIELEFREGLPVKLNGESLELWQLIDKLNFIGGRNGVGILDHVEDRIIGIKSREFYEAPAATIIIKAHKELEKLVSTRLENWFKPHLDEYWTNLVYSGLWVEPLLRDIESFINNVNKKVSGWIRLKLYKGSVHIAGRESENSLYDYGLATYEEDQLFNQNASPGFIELFGLQSRIAFRKYREW